MTDATPTPNRRKKMDIDLKERTEAQIGDIVYEFDINRRVYRQDEKGRSVGGPIYREYYRPRYIVGTVGHSWLVSNTPDGKFPGKIAKVKLLTADQVEADCWVQDHRHKVGRLLDTCQDADIIKAIAALLDYQPA